jgi:hypothetical protein
LGVIDKLYEAYQDRVAFLMVYVQEAHPADGWQMESNESEDVVFNQPKSLDERRGIAKACCERMEVGMPTVVDDMNNTVDALYAAWPERMFILDTGGRVAYAGKRGPWGFKPEEVERWLKRNIGPAKQ